MAAAPPAYVPLILPTAYKRYTRVEGSIPYSSGQSSNALRIDQSGTLLSLLLTFTGTVNVPQSASAPTLDPRGPYNLIKRVNLSGGGPGKIVALPGYALRVLEQVREADYTPTNAGWSTGGGGGGSGGTNYAVTFDVVVPICVRDGDLVGEWSDYLGCIFTGDQNLQLRLSIDWDTPATVFSAGSTNVTITGQINVTSMKLDTPAPAADASLLTAISWSHQLIAEQENVGISAAGPLATLADLPTAQPRAYLRVLDLIRNNAVPANGVIASLDAEIQDTIDFERQIDEQTWLARQARRYGESLPVGTYVLDFSAGNRRDNWLPVGSVTIFRWRPTISSVSLTNAVLDRYSEVVVPSSLAATWMQQASPAVLTAALGGSAAAAA